MTGNPEERRKPSLRALPLGKDMRPIRAMVRVIIDEPPIQDPDHNMAMIFNRYPQLSACLYIKRCKYALLTATLTLMAFLLFPVLATAQDVAASITVSDEEAELVVFNRYLTTFRATVVGLSPAERVRRSSANIDRALAQNGPGVVRVKTETFGNLLLIDDMVAIGLTSADADPTQAQTLDEITRLTVSRLESFIEDTRESRDVKAQLRSLIIVAIATGIFIVAILILNRAKRAFLAWLLRTIGGQAEKLKVAGTEVLRKDRLRSAGKAATRVVWWIIALLLCYQWLSVVLNAFPYTRPWGAQLQGYLVGVLARIGGAILDSIPNLTIAALIFFMAKGVIGAFRPLFDHIERGHGTSSWLDQDTVRPTRRITTVLIWIFALVMAYPYLPGAQTEAFKGMSVLLGLMISLGASSIVGQAASGVILMYSRSIRKGEYVRIGDCEGIVTEVSMLTTRIQTGSGEEINLPNSMIVSSATRNFSRAVAGKGYVVDTTLSIGYDTPWRQVVAMVEEAARRTPDVLQDPPPRVVQARLDDHYPVYRVLCHARPEDEHTRGEVIDRLLANIQDVFNEYGVAIMSPHYVADPSAPKVVPPELWYPAPAKREP